MTRALFHAHPIDYVLVIAYFVFVIGVGYLLRSRIRTGDDFSGPAMLFLGLYMMPFYYISKARSVPEYLKFRYNAATRAVNVISFADRVKFQ